MERRDFLKTMGIGVAATAAGSNLLTSCAAKATALEALPSFGLISGSSGSWHSDGPKEGLKQIAEWGYKDLEGGGIRGMDNDELLPFLKSLGLRLVVGSATMAVLIDEEKLKPVIKNAQDQGRQYLTCYWPWLAEARHTVDGWKEVTDNLNKGAAVCKREGITLIYHNHDMEFYPVEGQMPIDVMMAGLDPAVGIQLDLYWITKSGQSAEEYLKKYPGRYPVLHVKDMPATVKCGQGLTDFGKLTEADFSAIGSGVVDFPSIFRLNAISGAKYFFVESDKPGDFPTFLETSAKYLRELRF
jgi:sugar phosphate isomerase/epimerase